MRSFLIAAALTSALASSFPAVAAEDAPMPDIGNGLWLLCEGTKSPDSRGFGGESSAFCFGYIIGVAEGLLPGMANAKQWCFQPGVTAAQKFATVMKFLEEHPELRHKPTVTLVNSALRPIYACRTPAK